MSAPGSVSTPGAPMGWLEAAYRAIVDPPARALDHDHARHPAEHISLADYRAVLCYKLLVLGDTTVEGELSEIESYVARFERFRLAKEEQERQAIPQDRNPEADYSIETPYVPTLDEMVGLRFCRACQRLGRRPIWPAGAFWPLG